MSWLSDIFGGKTRSNTNTTSKRDPYAPTIEPIKRYVSSVEQLFNGGAPQISPYEQQGYDMLQQTAGSSPMLDAAQTENTKTLQGDYLSPDTNPYLADIAKRVSGLALSNVNSTFGGAGRTGGGLHAKLAGQGVADSLTDLYGSNYAQERGRMGQAVGMAPGLDAARYVGPSMMINAGQDISARPFELATQYGGILGNIAQLGGSSKTSSYTENKDASKGIFGKTVGKLFQ